MKYTGRAAVVLVAMALIMGWSATSFAQEGSIGGQSESMERNGLGIHAGLFLADNDPMLGAEGRFTFDLSPDFGLTINPRASYVFVSSEGDVSQQNLFFDVNALAMMNLDAVRPYAGAGLNVWFARFSLDGESDSETEINPNLLVLGAEFIIDESMLGFADLQLTRFSFSDPFFGSFSTTEATLRAGINFGL